MGCTQSSRSYSLPSIDAPYVVSGEVAWSINDDDDSGNGVVLAGSKSLENLDIEPMNLDDVIELAFNNNDVTRGSIANVIVKSFRFLKENGGAVNVTEHMAGLEANSHSTVEAFVANLRRNEAQLQYSLHSLWDLGHFEKKEKKYLERNIALCLHREETYAGFERYFHNQSGLISNSDSQSPAKVWLPSNLNMYYITVRHEKEAEETIYAVTTTAALSECSKTKDTSSLTALGLLEDQRLLEDPLETQKRAYQPLDAIRARSSSVLDLLDLIRHHVRRAIGEQNEFILYETIQEMVITNYEMEMLCQETAANDGEDIPTESYHTVNSALESQMTGAFNHLYMRLNFFLRDDANSLSEIKASVTALEYSVGKMMARAQPYVEQLCMTECTSTLNLVHKILLRRDHVLSQLLSTIVAAFIFTLHEHIDSAAFLEQLKDVGLFVCLQSLLDSTGKERAMLEDEIVAVRDLSHVKIRLNLASSSNTEIEIEGPRYDYIVSVPLPSNVVDRLTEEMKQWWGGEKHLIPIYPVLFNVGMETNTQKTLKNVNQEGLERCKRVVEISSDAELIRKLESEVSAGKNRNGRILLLASELSQKLHGLTIISCANGADRTSLAAAHNFTRILTKNHGLRLVEAPEVVDRLFSGDLWNTNAARIGRRITKKKKNVLLVQEMDRV